MGGCFHNTGAFSPKDLCSQKEYITIHELIKNKELQLTVLTSKNSGLENKISNSKVVKLRKIENLPFGSHNEKIIPETILLLDKKNLAYIFSKDEGEQVTRFCQLCDAPISCFLIEQNENNLKKLIEIAENKKKPVLTSNLEASVLLPKIISYLKTELEKVIFVHGSLLNIFGLGVLVMGKSGIGKSESALSLISLGHQLIADDLVRIRLQKPHTLIGTAPSLIRYHLEIRGLGIINIAKLFGNSAVMEKKDIGLIISLEKWANDHEYDRIGSDQRWITFLGVTLPLIKLPVAPGRHLAIIIEAGVRKQLLLNEGINPARDLEKKIIHRFCP